MKENNRVAIYCRLSEEDRNKGDLESESIQNQKAMLLQYANDQNWQVTEIYCDEDYTGADRSRPAFNKLLRDAQDRRFDIVLCKSQSRFTRELELVEKYLHGLFSAWGIRFVGYADHADTANQGNKKARQINGLVNEWYLEDLSDNIRSVFRSKQSSGLFIGSFAPYGYRKSEQNKNRLVPDENAADIVKEIFEKSAQGKNLSAVAHELNDRGLPNPSTYKAQQQPGFRRAGMRSTAWSAATIRSILQNPVYYGCLRQHLREKVSYKSDAVRRVPEEEQVFVENTHEALVTKELWEKAQPKAGQSLYGQRKKDPLRERYRCAVCGKVLYVRYSHEKRYFACREHGVLIREEILEQWILPQTEQEGRKVPENFCQTEQEMELLQTKIKSAYDDMAAGLLRREQFEAMNRVWQKRWSELLALRQDATKRKEQEFFLLVYPRETRSKQPKVERISAQTWQKRERQGMVSTMPQP